MTARGPVRCMLLAAAAVLLIVPVPLHAQGRDIAIEHMDQQIGVSRNASIDVTETLRIRFDGSWNGIERDYWLDHETGTGRVARLRMDVRSVTDADGTPLRVEEEGIPQGRRLRIWVPGASDATRTVVVRYTIPDVIRFWEEDDPHGARDELYWDVTGNAWEMFIGRVTATVTLPAAVEPTESWAYTGAAGSAGRDATIETVANSVRFETTRAFAPGEGLTVSVAWPPGVVERPNAAQQFADTFLRFWPLAVPFLAFFGMFRVWSRHGKDPAARSIAVQYEPPNDLTPVEAGTLVDHTVEMHDITSMLVDLAVRGFLVIEEREEKKLLGLMSSTEYWFHARRGMDEWRDLPRHEFKLMTALFSSPSSRENGLPSVKLDDLENKFYTHVPGIRTTVYDSLIAKGHYRKRPDKVRARWIALAGAVLVGAFIGSAILSERPWLGDPAAAVAGFVLSALIVGGFGVVMPTRTDSGARAQEAALGFKEFLSRVEQDRFKRMITSPEQFEKFLPFAMAFRVEQRWARAFEDLYREPPDWYHGRPGYRFRTTSFANSLNTMSMQAGKTMASSPSSSSSGSGGGGFSGGGSGGGGGRGF